MSGEPIDGAATGGFPIGEVIGLVIAIVLLIVVLRNLRAARNALLAAFAGLGFGFGALMWAGLRHRRARPRADPRRHARPRRRHRLRAAARLAPAGRAAGRSMSRSRPRAAPTPPRATPRSPRPASCSSRSPACSSPASRSWAAPASPPVSSCSPAPSMCVVLLPARFARSGRRMLPRRERAARRRAARYARAVGHAPARPRARSPPPPSPIALAAPAAGLELGQPDDRNLSDRRHAAPGLRPSLRGLRRRASTVRWSSPSRSPRTAPARSLQRLDAGARAPTARSPPSRRPSLNQARRHGRHHRHAARTARRTTRRARSSTGSAPRRSPPRSRASSASAYVGGRTARFGDEAEKIASRIPLFAAAVVGLSLLLLLAAFRSWRIVAAVGAVQPRLDRRGLRRRRARVPDQDRREPARRRAAAGRPLRAAVHVRDPVRALHGLQRVPDLARPRGVAARHPDHRAAIAAASAGTRKIIAAAGAIMIAVFLGFATDPDPVIKMTGIGLASAVLVDITLVRMFMAPAALTLLGDRLWPERRRRTAPRVAAGAGERVLSSLRSTGACATVVTGPGATPQLSSTFALVALAVGRPRDRHRVGGDRRPRPRPRAVRRGRLPRRAGSTSPCPRSSSSRRPR